MTEAQEPKKEVVNWSETLAKHARAATAIETPSTLPISIRGGYMKLNGQDVPSSDLDCIVVASVFENQYYDPNKPFDPDNLQNPVCFAQSIDGENMRPDPASTQMQHDGLCVDCKWMQWKSDPIRKKGKACKEKRKLALIPASQLKVGAVNKAEMAVLAIPVTSVGNWSNYVNLVANDTQRPPFGVLTRVSSRPSPRTQLEVTFAMQALVADDYIGDVIARVSPAQEAMMQPYEGTPDDPTKARKF